MLVDRDGELAAVDRVLSAARAGAGAALLVEGPPGIGKTSLLAAARDSAGGFRVLSARGSELERDFPFAVARQLLEGALEPELLTGAAALAAPVLMDSAAEAGPAALHGLYWLTANLAARTPLLVVADDLHWADVASLRWLAYLVQRLDGLACAVVMGTRPAEGDHGLDVLDVLATHPSVEALHPGGLSVAATARIVERELGSPEESFAAACHAVTGGNPFLLGELLRELTGVAPTAENAALVTRQTSRTVSRAALARLRRLPPAATALANATAILGDHAEPHLAARLAELTPAEAATATDSLVAATILAGADDDGAAPPHGGAAPASGGAAPPHGGAAPTRDGAAPASGGAGPGHGVNAPASGVAASPRGVAAPPRGIAAPVRVLAFAHPLVRSSVYAELGPGERSRLHSRAAALLAEAGRPAERIAIHAHNCDPAADPGAVGVLRAAAAEARRRGDTEVAASHLRRALREPPDPDALPHVRLELGLAELDGGDPATAAEHLSAAAAELSDPAPRARAAMRLSLALQMSGRPEDGVAALNDAIAALPDAERELGLLLQAVRGGASQGNLAAAARAAEPRFTADLHAPRTLGERLFAGGVAYREATSGSAARAIELARLGLVEDPGAPASFVAPLALLFAGALEEATDAFTAVVEHGRRTGSVLGFAAGSHLRAAAWWRRGNLLEAEADADNALPYPSYMIRPGVIALVEIRLVQGDVEGATAVWRDAGMDAEPLTGRAAVVTRNAHGRLLAAQGRGEDALAELRACGRMEAEWGVTTPGYATWRADAVTLLAALGRGEEARELAAEDVERSRRFGDPRTLGMSLRAAGLAAAAGAGASPGARGESRREAAAGAEAARAASRRAAGGSPSARGESRGRGAAGGTAAAIELLAESVAVLTPSPARLELALSLLELGAAHRRAGRRVDARVPLRDAVELAKRCGATRIAARAHDELVAAGAKPRRDPTESRSRLTASEARVARMAAEGMTNREIAQALFLTEKTIEVHLTSTYRKLDIASRSQLPRALG